MISGQRRWPKDKMGMQVGLHVPVNRPPMEAKRIYKRPRGQALGACPPEKSTYKSKQRRKGRTREPLPAGVNIVSDDAEVFLTGRVFQEHQNRVDLSTKSTEIKSQIGSSEFIGSSNHKGSNQRKRLRRARESSGGRWTVGNGEGDSREKGIVAKVLRLTLTFRSSYDCERLTGSWTFLASVEIPRDLGSLKSSLI